VYLILKINNIN